MVRRVLVRYERDLDQPIGRAYSWLTDYDDRDGEIAGAIIERRVVLERHADRYVLQGQLSALGRSREGRAEVQLFPPDHWRAQLFDAKGRAGDVYDYRLEPRAGGQGSKLVVDYNFIAPKAKHVIAYWLARRKLVRELDKMWDGFVSAMDKDLAR